MSGGISITPGYVWDEVNGEPIDLAKLNQQVQAMVLRLDEAAVTNRELADGSISADKLDDDLSVQLGIPDGSITTAKLAANVLSADVTGRTKMQDGFLSADAGGRAKMADDYITTAKLLDDVLSADATGLGKMEDGYLSADAAGRAKMASGFIQYGKIDTRQAMEKDEDAFLFHAYRTANYSVAPGSYQVVQLNGEQYDPANVFNTSTYKYQPGVNGHFSIVGAVSMQSIPIGKYIHAVILKNGTIVANGSRQKTAVSDDPVSVVSCQVRLTVGTDYIQLGILHDSASSKTVVGVSPGNTYMMGHMIARL